jgi:hypothetical protein
MSTLNRNGEGANPGLPLSAADSVGVNGNLEYRNGRFPEWDAYATAAAAPTPRALLRALRRRWFLALTTGLIAAALAFAGVSFFLPQAQQRAFAKLSIPEPVLDIHTDRQLGVRAHQDKGLSQNASGP